MTRYYVCFACQRRREGRPYAVTSCGRFLGFCCAGDAVMPDRKGR